MINATSIIQPAVRRHKQRQRSRMCRWCGQAYTLGRRRDFLSYCGFHCYWFDMEAIYRRYHPQTFSIVPLEIAGGDGIIHLMEGRIYTHAR